MRLDLVQPSSPPTSSTPTSASRSSTEGPASDRRDRAARPAGRTIDAGGIRTHYHEAGPARRWCCCTGPGPAYRPGRTGSTPSRRWPRTTGCIAPDLVGFGDTERPQDASGTRCADLDRPRVGLPGRARHRADVPGRQLARRADRRCGWRRSDPDRLHEMVLMGCTRRRHDVHRRATALRDYEPSAGEHARAAAQLLRGRSAIITDDLVRTRYEASIAPGAYEAYRACSSTRGTPEASSASPKSRSRRYRHPTLLVHGLQDKVVPCEVSWNDGEAAARRRPARVRPVRALDADRAGRRVQRAGQRTSWTEAPDDHRAADAQATGPPARLPSWWTTTLRATGSGCTARPMTSPEIFGQNWIKDLRPQLAVRRPRIGDGRNPGTTSGGRSAAARCSWSAASRPATSTCSTTPAPTAGPWCAGRSPATPRCSSASTTPGPSTSEGRLAACPDRDAYGGELDFAQLGLGRVARVENYRGFVFASFDPDVTDLATYLAGRAGVPGPGHRLRRREDARSSSGTNEYCMRRQLEAARGEQHRRLPRGLHPRHLLQVPRRRWAPTSSGGVSGAARDLGNGHAVLEYAGALGPADRQVGAAVR